MKITMKLYAIVIAVTSLALAPSLIAISPADANSHYCRDQKGKSQDWVYGCQRGWADHNECSSYNPEEPGAYASGYKVGWKHGSCK
jgi:hypothetical protein